MSNLVTTLGLKNALQAFLDNLIHWLPIKGFTVNGKSNSHTLTVNNDSEIAMGRYNISSPDTLMSVGNGSEGSRKNALEVTTDGGVYIMNGEQKMKLQDMAVSAIPVEVVNKLN